MSGKGRAGSLVVSYLLFTNSFQDHHRAILYYKEKRGVGVTHPGQRRYLEYLEIILKNGPGMFRPLMKKLLCVAFHGIPNISNNSCRPCIDIYNVRDDLKIFSEKFDDLRKDLIKTKEGKAEKAELFLRDGVILFGDTFIKFSHAGTLSNKKMFRLSFNSNTIGKDTKMEFTLDMLDPDVTKKNPAYPKDFKVTLFFETLDIDPTSSEHKLQCEGFEAMQEVYKYRADTLKKEKDYSLSAFGHPDFDDRDEMMIMDLDESCGSELSGDEN